LSKKIDRNAIPGIDEFCWARVKIPGRSDFIGVRRLPDGQYEFLTRNEGLCNPYYLTRTGRGASWDFTYARAIHAYVPMQQEVPA
jgi:hypothetical protein